MSQSPWVIGQTHPGWAETWVDDSKNPIDLTGATLSGIIGLAGSGVTQPLKSTPTILTAATGQFAYVVAENEVSAPGKYTIRFKAVFPDGKPLWSDRIDIVFVDAAGDP